MQALIIDDSRATRRILGDMLMALGFEVTEAANGAEALEGIDPSRPPAVALVDWHMPIMDGLEFILNLRASNNGHKIPIMMVTTSNELDEVAVALEAGADEYVMKPFSKECIEDKLKLMGVLEINA